MPQLLLTQFDVSSTASKWKTMHRLYVDIYTYVYGTIRFDCIRSMEMAKDLMKSYAKLSQGSLSDFFFVFLNYNKFCALAARFIFIFLNNFTRRICFEFSEHFFSRSILLARDISGKLFNIYLSLFLTNT